MAFPRTTVQTYIAHLIRRPVAAARRGAPYLVLPIPAGGAPGDLQDQRH